MPLTTVLLLVSLLSRSVLGTPARAEELHERALSFARTSSYAQALPLFQQAVEEDPSNANYVNNAGVTLLRLQRFQEAAAAFERALELNPRHPDAKANLKETRGFMRSSSSTPTTTATPRPPRPIRHTVHALPRVHIRDLYAPHNAAFANFRAPFVLTGLVKDSKLLERRFRPSRLASAYGDASADFYPHNMEKSDVHPFIITLGEALSELQAPSGRFPRTAARPGTYVQWNMRMHQWDEFFENSRFEALFHPFPLYLTSSTRWLLNALPNDALRNEFCVVTHWRMMLIGGTDAGMFNHQDSLKTASYNMQVRGAKKWHICAPDQSLHLSVDFDAFDPDYDAFPQARKASCYFDTIVAGELLHYPNDYWHQTLNVPSNASDVAISFTDTLVDPASMRELANQMRDKCDRSKPNNTPFSDQLCPHVEAVLSWWMRAYPDMGPLNFTALAAAE